jgi:hypothetical protein
MTNLTITASAVALVKEYETVTLPVGEAVTAGQIVRLDTSTGKLTKGNGTAAGEARIIGVAVQSSKYVNDPITVVKRGLLDLGAALDGVTLDAVIYASDTDGTLADSAGTVSTKIGRVVPNFAHTDANNLLFVDIAL